MIERLRRYIARREIERNEALELLLRDSFTGSSKALAGLVEARRTIREQRFQIADLTAHVEVLRKLLMSHHERCRQPEVYVVYHGAHAEAVFLTHTDAERYVEGELASARIGTLSIRMLPFNPTDD